jgi:hypothetical protein
LFLSTSRFTNDVFRGGGHGAVRGGVGEGVHDEMDHDGVVRGGVDGVAHDEMVRDVGVRDGVGDVAHGGDHVPVPVFRLA